MFTKTRVMGIQISSSKVNCILYQIRGLQVEKALVILRFSKKKTALYIKNLLISTLSNVEYNLGVDINTYYISTIYATQGASLKRFFIKAKGSNSKILKRTSNIFLEITNILNKKINK